MSWGRALRRAVALVTAALFSAGAALLGALALSRASLPYNEEGRYFDAEYSVVYHEGSGLVFGLLAGLFGIAALGALIWVRKEWRR